MNSPLYGSSTRGKRRPRSSARMSACTHVMRGEGCFRLPSAIMAASCSTPVTRTPSLASAAAMRPAPTPSSSAVFAPVHTER